MSLFVCPLCGSPLERQEHTYLCPNRHSFDRAREGYVHLLPPDRKHSAAPGDDKEMSAARRDFLSAGHYRPLLDALCRTVVDFAGSEPVFFDAGCGEGYYTSGIHRALADAGKNPHTAGIDISKFILRSAAKREREAEFAVASSYHLPLADASCDILLNCFSPLALEEFLRVLKPGGLFLYVVPGADHLWEMKEILYEKPYRNEEKETPYAGFVYREILPVDFRMQLSKNDIQSLFHMTPYAWKTPRAGRERLSAVETLDLQASFRIHVYTKE